jgi:2-amino-4-hydroxy-6-hydroxymethyldihydropteridine diphosphokinase
VGRQSYLIAFGGNHAKSRAMIATLLQQRDTVAASKIHTTAPLGPGKRHYANAVALIETDLDPPALLAQLKRIERNHGRRAGRRWGDRPLDLDIIGWSGGIWASRTLSIPHPAFRERRFVLAPLVEVAPGWRDLVTGLTSRHLLARLDKPRMVGSPGFEPGTYRLKVRCSTD